MTSILIIGRQRLTLLAALTLTFGCSSPIGPDIREVQLDLATIQLNVVETGVQDQNVVEVMATPADQSRILRTEERVRVELTSSTGDEEVVLLGPARCEDNAGASVDCYRFVVSMDEGVPVEAIRDQVTTLGAQLVPSAICSMSEGCEQPAPSLGRILVFEPSRLTDVMAAVGRFEDVAFVERLHIATIMSLGQSDHGVLYAPIRLAPGESLTDDGTVQVSFTETASISAIHPSASVTISMGGD